MQSDAQRENTRVVLKQLFDLWERKSERYGPVLFCSAIAKGYDGKWRNATSFLFPLQKDERVPSGVQASYEDLKLVKGTMALDEAKAVLSKMVESDRLCFPGAAELEIEVSMHPTNPKSFWDSGWRRFPLAFPFHEFSFNVEQNSKGQSPQNSLYSIALPLFPSGKEAIEHFFGARLGDNSSYNGLFFALVPDYRARIQEIRIGTNSVEIQVLCPGGNSEKNLIGKLYAQTHGGVADSADLSFTEDRATAKISGFPRDLLVALLSKKDGELVDRRQYLSGDQYRTQDVMIEAPEQDIEQTIQMGESEVVEFKREIPSRRDDIAISATALANHRGGRILIGVADDCQVVGCRLDKPKDIITQILRSHCDPFPAFFVEEVTIADLPVVVVRVTEGDDKPYSVKDRGVYVRRGSTNRVATRYELDEMYGTKANLLGM